MESLYLLIPLSIVAVAVAVGLFFHMSSTGQFDDHEGPAWSVLMDDDSPRTERERARRRAAAPADADRRAPDRTPPDRPPPD